MYHHSSADYKTSASAAAVAARDKFQTTIDKGLESAMSVIEQVETQIIQDRLAHATKMTFDASSLVEQTVESENGIELLDAILSNTKQKSEREIADSGALSLILKDEETKIHNHALRQSVEKAGFPNPKAYIDFLYSLKGEGRDILASNLNRVFSLYDKNFLVRNVGGETRGILSDKFARKDSRPLLNAFVEACQEIGAIPVKGYALETKVNIRAILPYVFEPVENEVMMFGLEWGNSDFGDGAHHVKLFNVRLWCSNYATLEEVLRNIHLGKRLDDSINYSQETYDADSTATALALRDTVRDVLSPQKVDAMVSQIKKAFETEITPGTALTELKKYLNKGEVEEAVAVFNSPDVVNLPPGQNKLRLINAVTWIANSKDAYRQLELQDAAGKMFPKVAVATA